MAILAGFDVHRAQITFDALNTETGEVLRGRLRADREAVGEWVGQFAGEHVQVAVQACPSLDSSTSSDKRHSGGAKRGSCLCFS